MECPCQGLVVMQISVQYCLVHCKVSLDHFHRITLLRVDNGVEDFFYLGFYLVFNTVQVIS